MNRLRAYVVGALSALLLVSSVFPGVTNAASNSSGITGGSASLSIDPRKNYVMDPGQTITDKLTINNLDNGNPLYLTLHLRDFTFSGETGIPKIFLADNAPQTAWSLKPFMSLPKNVFTIPAGGSKTIPYTITIPKSQGGGSYYSAIQYSSGSGSTGQGQNVGLSASGITLAFVNVSGKVNEHLELKKLGAFMPDPSGTTGKYVFLTTKQPKQISYSLENTGNVAEAPAGSITVKNMFGHVVASIDNANPHSLLALRGQTRRFDACLVTKQEAVKFVSGSQQTTDICEKVKLWPGRYSVSLATYYGFNGNVTQEVSGNASFWYLPWWFLLLIAAVIAFVIYKYLQIKRKLEARKRSKYRGRR
jgi:hypothetical protein